jgi:hypothetical protein
VTPNIRLYEALIALAVGSIGAGAFTLAWRLAGRGVTAPVTLLPFILICAVYLFGVSRYVWRVVGECEFSAWVCAARLTEYRRVLKLPLVRVWLLY